MSAPRWPVRRLKTLAEVRVSNVDKKSAEGEEQVQLCNYTDVYYRDRIDTSIDFMTATAPEHQVRSFGLRTDDVLITKDSESWDDIAVPAVVAEPVDAVCGYHLALLRPKPERVDGRFLGYSIKAGPASRHFKVEANGVTRYAIGLRAIGDAPIPAPPLAKQKAAADYLDSETARIDTLIDRKQRFIDLLLEKRTALITHAVTKGLDPDAEMKDSGVAWLGQVPASWDVVGSKRLFALRNMRACEDDTQLTASQVYGVIPQDDFMALEGRRVVQVIKDPTILKHVEPGDFVISMRSFQGGIERSDHRGCVSSAYVVLRPQQVVHAPFFTYLLKSSSYIQALQSTSDLVRDGQALRYENFAQVRLPLVPMEQQIATADFLSAQTARMDALADKTRRSIDLLREYRTALISAAVTGQIDIPGTEASEEVA